MPEDSKEEVEQPTPSDATEGSEEPTPEAGPTGATPRLGLHGLLTRASDVTQRPGFRNPSNKRSKAQKKRRKKRR